MTIINDRLARPIKRGKQRSQTTVPKVAFRSAKVAFPIADMPQHTQLKSLRNPLPTSTNASQRSPDRRSR
ncbi:hypothetical protein C2E31_28300 [Rhodopirellula baltica]|nr:hypothetical protein C2E31_28300 [Rhodopirellula baltica]